MRGLAAIAVILIGAFTAITIAFISKGALGMSPREELRPLTLFYLNNTYNVFNRTMWASSPETVNAILWDYRGLDTVYETVVLYLALIGCLVIAGIVKRVEGIGVGLTLIVRTSVKIVMALIILVSLSLAFRGYICPGGGFQGGAALAIAPLLIIAAYSVKYLEKLGFTLTKSIILRSLGLLSIALIALTPIAYKGLVLQNQPKGWTAFKGYPHNISGIYTAGTLLFLNASELLVVSMEFLMIFIILSIIRAGVKSNDRT